MPFLVEVELAGGPKLKGHDYFWEVIRDLGAEGATFTISDVVQQTSAHRDTVGDFIRRLTRTAPPILERAGFRQVRNDWRPMNTARAQLYRLLRSPVDTPSVRRDGSEGGYGRRRQHMWNILRGPQAREGINAPELAMLAETEELPIAEGTAAEFLWRLDVAGYLVVLEKPANNRKARYRLRPGQGPKAPKLLHTTMVYDPNRREIVGPAIGSEDQR